MAKFCGKCGTRLDETTGLCPNCDAKKIEKSKKYQKEIINRKKKILKLKIILGILILIIVTGGVFLLRYFGIVNVPVISEASEEEDTSEGNVSVSVLGKNFTDKRITDETSAVAAAKDVAETMGYQNAFSELKVKVSTSVDGKSFYRLQQYYKGLPVYGRYVTVVSSEDGNALGINSAALDVDADIEMKPQISDEQMQTAIKEYMKGKAGILYEDMDIPEISDDFLVIYNQSGESRLAYAVKVINDDTYNIVVDACTGEILEGSSGVDSIAATGTNVAGTKQFPVEYDESANTYTLQDQARGIYVYNFNKSSHKNKKTWGKKTEVVSVNDNVFGNTEEEANQSPEIGINLLKNIEEIEDYYQTTFNQGNPYELLILAYNDGYKGGKNAVGGCGDGTDTETGEMCEYGLVYIGHKMRGTERDILAHEYTHIIERKYGAACGEAVETNAVNEGLADTFACFYTGQWGIDLECIGGTYRSASDPGKYNYPASLDDKNKSGENDNHGYATVVSHAVYLMNQSKTFSEKELQLLWYETLLQLPYNCTFYDLRACMEQTAIISDYPETQKQAIATAFDEVGVFEKGEYKCNNSININVYDKQGEYYDDYNIRIDGTTSEGFAGMGEKKYSLSVDNQSAEKYHLDLQNGKYTITITDKADETVVKTFKIKVKKSNHREELYAFDFGADYSVAPQAKLTFLDAEGNEMSDYSVSASYKDGKYAVDSNSVDLGEGNYYIGLFSKELDESGTVYYETFSLRIKNGLKSSETIQTGFEVEEDENKDVLVVPITPTDDTEIWNTFLQEKQYEPNITDWTITELQYCLLDIDQDGRKELILTPGTNWDDFQIYQVYTIGEDEKVYLADDFTACYGISYSSKYKALAYNSCRPSEMSASLEYYAMDGTKMTESFAVNMEVDLNTYLPVYNVHNIIKGTDTSITEAEYEAYQKECTPLTEWKTLESKSAKKNFGKTQTSGQEWKTAYAQFLRNGEYKSDMPGCDAPRFFVYDVDGDGSMELVIIRATYSVVGGDVYALVNGKVIHAGGTSGTYGSFASYPSDGLLLSSYGHMGVDLEEYFTLSDGKLVSQARWISSFTDGETWYLNDQETTQEAYETWKAEHVNGEIFAVEYQDAHPITEENIQAYVK